MQGDLAVGPSSSTEQANVKADPRVAVAEVAARSREERASSRRRAGGREREETEKTCKGGSVRRWQGRTKGGRASMRDVRSIEGRDAQGMCVCQLSQELIHNK